MDLSSTRAKLALALIGGGGVGAAGASTSLLFEQTPKLEDNSITPTMVESTGITQVLDTPVEESVSKTPEVYPVISGGESDNSAELKNKKDEAFENLGNKLTENYKAKQSDQEIGENAFNGKIELKNILDSEEYSESGGLIEKEEYKDCSSVRGGKTDHCAYLQLKYGNKEYRLKIDRYGAGGQGKLGDVTLIRKNGNTVQSYLEKEKMGKLTNYDLNNFQGGSNSAYNAGMKLDEVSINTRK